ncbi:MAG: phosphatase PAP2 family protein, partial [Saprospiraceae bacterium]
CLLFSLIFALSTAAQSPYAFSLKKELPIISLGLGTGGIGALLRANTEGLTLPELEQLDPLNISTFDRFATENLSLSAQNASDVFFYCSHVLPLTLLAGQRVRQDRWRGPLMWLEGYLVNAGITGLIKYTVKRPRPFAFNAQESLELRQSRDARTAMLSGHTSVTAYNTFFTAQVFSDYYPNSRAKPWIWIGAAVLPAITGYLRVKGGRHYPTDVIAGYALGALTGILVPRLHRKRN